MINLNTNNRIVLTNNLSFAIIFLKMDVEKFATHLKVCTVCMHSLSMYAELTKHMKQIKRKWP